MNDYIFTEPEHGFSERHFSIRYDVPLNRYFLKDLGQGTGTFLKILKPVGLQNGNLFSIGKDINFMVFINSQEMQPAPQLFNEN